MTSRQQFLTGRIEGRRNAIENQVQMRIYGEHRSKYRSNRYARAGHHMMAMRIVDIATGDLRFYTSPWS
jgi:hypothetical protein